MRWGGKGGEVKGGLGRKEREVKYTLGRMEGVKNGTRGREGKKEVHWGYGKGKEWDEDER